MLWAVSHLFVKRSPKMMRTIKTELFHSRVITAKLLLSKKYPVI